MANACHASAQISLVRINRMGQLVKIAAMAHRGDENMVVSEICGLFGLIRCIRGNYREFFFAGQWYEVCSKVVEVCQQPDVASAHNRPIRGASSSPSGEAYRPSYLQSAPYKHHVCNPPHPIIASWS